MNAKTIFSQTTGEKKFTLWIFPHSGAFLFETHNFLCIPFLAKGVECFFFSLFPLFPSSATYLNLFPRKTARNCVLFFLRPGKKSLHMHRQVFSFGNVLMFQLFPLVHANKDGSLIAIMCNKSVNNSVEIWAIIVWRFRLTPKKRARARGIERRRHTTKKRRIKHDEIIHEKYLHFNRWEIKYLAE